MATKTAQRPIDKLREQVLERGVSSIKRLGRTFRIMDDDRDGGINLEGFQEGLRDYGVTLSPEEVQELFTKFDKDGNGTLCFDEFIVAFRGHLNDERLKVVEEAFKKIDKTGDGNITAADMKGVYNVKDNPKVTSGEWTEEECLTDWLKTFEPDEDKRDAVVTLEEFKDYYAGVSANIDNHDYFRMMVENAWMK